MPTVVVLISSVAVFLGIFIFLYFVPLGLWFTAWVADAPVTLTELIMMRIRKVPPELIVQNLITAKKAGLYLSPLDLEAHHLAGGKVASVVEAAITAHRAGLQIDFKLLTALDLAGQDVHDAVERAIRAGTSNISYF